MILFSVYDSGVKLIAEPHIAQTLESAKLSLGRFFVENESMKDRMDSTKLVVIGEWDSSVGLVQLRSDDYSARECFEDYLKEVAKQNEEAVSNSDGSI